MKVKCLVDLGERGEQIRHILLKNSEDKAEFESELDGMLLYDREFLTEEGEIIAGTQIILEIKEVKKE